MNMKQLSTWIYI